MPPPRAAYLRYPATMQPLPAPLPFSALLYMVHFMNIINPFYRFSAYFSATHRQPCALAHRHIPSAHRPDPRPLALSRRRRPSSLCESVNSHLFSAGVQTMRARICSASSCDMFARVVWLRLRRAQNYRFSLCHLSHILATHYFLRLTRARGVSSQREGNALFDDFWYFSSLKSTIIEKFLYVSIRRQQASPKA